MDFWSRLLSPLSSGTPRKDQAKDPAKRLHRFEKEYASLLSTWRNSPNLSRDSEAVESLEIRLQELTNTLSDEMRRPLPHPCIQYSSIKQIYVPIGKIATTSYNEWIIKEAVLFFATLIESEEDAFVENATFAASLTNLLVKITGVNSIRLGLDTESRVVELAFNITTKIRLEPEILPAWFKTIPTTGQQRFDRDSDQHGKFEGKAQRADFPLFYILMDYIHHEGKVGDFARTGLLYIIEAASHSTALEQWIVESDLSTLMATGLGALYSQLSRKLVIDHLPHDLPPILALSDYQHPQDNFEIVSSCSPEFQSHLDTFLSHLLFWQDVLNHCKSAEVKSTLLEHFQVIFLQQLLYPSLLESSDIDGGSSVAVLTYLRRILESLDHPDMINLILHYLLDLPGASANKPPTLRTSISAARHRKSMDLATMMAEKNETTATPLLFNLVDLILACLRSRNQQTIHVTLQLVSAILKRHHRYAVITMLKTDILPVDAVHRTVGAHEQEVEYLTYLAGTLGNQAQADDTYDSMLKDMVARLESHPCSLRLIAPRVSVSNHFSTTPNTTLPGAPREVREHTLRPEDPLLNAMLDILENFFLNPVETNLSATETLVNLAVCGYMSVEGWLTRHPQKYAFHEEEETESVVTPTDDGEDPARHVFREEESMAASKESERLRNMEKCRRRPEWTQSSLPRILRVLKDVTDQAEAYQSQIPRFSELVQQRWEAFQTADMMLDQPPPPVRKSTPAPGGGQQGNTPDRLSLEALSRSTSPSRPTAIEGFAQRLLSELGTPSRSSSPRGRRDMARSSGTATPAGSVTSHGVSSPKMLPTLPPKDLPPLPTESARATTSNTNNNSHPPGTPQQVQGVSKEEVAAEAAKASQVADFAAIDQSILARKVGLPGKKVKVQPLTFDRGSQEREDLEEEEADKSLDTAGSELDAGSSSAFADGEDLLEDTEPAKPDDQETSRSKLGRKKTSSTKSNPSASRRRSTVKEPKTPPSRKKTHSKPGSSARSTSSATPSSSSFSPALSTPSKPPPPSSRTTHAKSQSSRSSTSSESSQSPGSTTGDGRTHTDDDEEEEDDEVEAGVEGGEGKELKVSVSHVVTNVLIFQSFLYELASLLQVRAGMFDEVKYV